MQQSPSYSIIPPSIIPEKLPHASQSTDEEIYRALKAMEKDEAQESFKIRPLHQNRGKIHKSLSQSSEFAKNAPKRHTPVAHGIRNYRGNAESQSIGYMSVEGMENEFAHEIDITYPASGRSYTIKRSEYPKFYKKLDANRDGKIRLYEISSVQHTITDITPRYAEGDINSVVRDFLKARF